LPSQPFFCEEFPSSLDRVGETLEHALASLRREEWIAPGQEFYARLCLEEALVNAVRHGNENDDNRQIRLVMTERDNRCEIRVYDEGQGFVPDDVLKPSPHEPGGRGVCLIRYCMENVRYDQSEGCLVMTMAREGLCKGGQRNE
jgi:anti-sigma regulatory factor (Ser/Thr protein kinase)